MSDLIDRQAAIDAVCMEWCGVKHQDCKHPFDVEKDDYYWCDGCETALRTLPDLPSAQPEQRWIPCSERLPEDGTWNIFSDGKNISVERYKMDAFDHFFPQGRWFSLDEAIAWMPLPEPYKEEQE